MPVAELWRKGADRKSRKQLPLDIGGNSLAHQRVGSCDIRPCIATSAVIKKNWTSHTTRYAGRHLRSNVVATATCEMGQ